MLRQHRTLGAAWSTPSVSIVRVLNRKSKGKENGIHRGLKSLARLFPIDITKRGEDAYSGPVQKQSAFTI